MLSSQPYTCRKLPIQREFSLRRGNSQHRVYLGQTRISGETRQNKSNFRFVISPAIAIRPGYAVFFRKTYFMQLFTKGAWRPWNETTFCGSLAIVFWGSLFTIGTVSINKNHSIQCPSLKILFLTLFINKHLHIWNPAVLQSSIFFNNL